MQSIIPIQFFKLRDSLYNKIPKIIKTTATNMFTNNDPLLICHPERYI